MLIRGNTPVTRSHSRPDCRVIRWQHCYSSHKSNPCTLCSTTAEHITPLCLFHHFHWSQGASNAACMRKTLHRTTSCMVMLHFPPTPRTTKAEMLFVYRRIGISCILWSREELLVHPYMLHNVKAWEDRLLVSQKETSKGRFSTSISNADLLTRKFNTITITWW